MDSSKYVGLFLKNKLLNDTSIAITGLYGKSTVRCVDVESGDVLKSTSLPDVDFGEGLVKLKDKLYQLTWQKPDGFIYDTKLKKV